MPEPYALQHELTNTGKQTSHQGPIQAQSWINTWAEKSSKKPISEEGNVFDNDFPRTSQMDVFNDYQ